MGASVRPDPVSDYLAALKSSSAASSIESRAAGISGGSPVIVRARSPSIAKSPGEYIGPNMGSRGDTLYLGSDKNTPSDFIAAHEYGHRVYDANDPDRPEQYRPNGTRYPDLTPIIAQIKGRHANTPPSEEFARAFSEVLRARHGSQAFGSDSSDAHRANPSDSANVDSWLGNIEHDPVSDYLSSLPAKAHDYHAEFKSGALQRRMDAANARDMTSAKEQDAASDVGQPGVAGSIADATQGIPGMGALQAGLRAVVRREPYRDAYTEIKTQTDKVPASAKMIGRTAASIPAVMRLPGSAALSGAIIGGANEALDANPDRGLLSRSLGTAAGAAGGAVLGKTTEMLGTAARTLWPAKLGGTPTPSANMFQRLADQSQSAKTLYGAANAEGKLHEATPAISSFLEQEDIAPIVQRLQQTTHQGVDAHSPEMLDALYKTLSDQAKNVEKGLAGPDPAKVNTGRYNLQWIKDRQKQLLSAMSAPGAKTTVTEAPPITTAQSPAPSLRDALSDFDRVKGVAAQRVDGTPAQQMARRALERHGAEEVVNPALSGAPPGPRTIETTEAMPAYMPSYRDAVQDFAKQSSAMDALKNARIIAQKKITNAQIPANALTKKTPEALQDMVANPRNAENLSAMREGILGAAKEELPKGFKAGRRAMGNTSSLLRITNDPTQATLDLLAKLGLSAASTAATP